MNYEKEDDGFLEVNEGSPLEIGVVGSQVLPAVGNITYEYGDLNEISTYVRGIC